MPGPNVTAGGRGFDVPPVDCAGGRVFRGTEYPYELDGGRGGPRLTYRIISSFILYVSKGATSVVETYDSEIKKTPYAVISVSSSSLELELVVSSSLSDWALAPPSLRNVPVVPA